MGQQISYLTVIVVHSTMHLMHHNHCQITTLCIVDCESNQFVHYYIMIHVYGQIYGEIYDVP